MCGHIQLESNIIIIRSLLLSGFFCWFRWYLLSFILSSHTVATISFFSFIHFLRPFCPLVRPSSLPLRLRCLFYCRHLSLFHPVDLSMLSCHLKRTMTHLNNLMGTSNKNNRNQNNNSKTILAFF